MFIVDVKNSIALIKEDDGRLTHVQTSTLDPDQLAAYWEARSREDKAYFAGKEQSTMTTSE